MTPKDPSCDTPRAFLMEAPAHVNPLIAAYLAFRRLEHAGELDLETLMLTRGAIDRALETGPKEESETLAALRVLIEAVPVPARHVPEGF
jgi:hypothetical protein